MEYIQYSCQTSELSARLDKSKGEFVLLMAKPWDSSRILWHENGLHRLLQAAEYAQADFCYCDYEEICVDDQGRNSCKPHPLIDCQPGSLRDDFDFGAVVLVRREAALLTLLNETEDYEYASWYALRLAMSKHKPLLHLNERLYTLNMPAANDFEAQMFSYVNPSNRAVQIEMEAACTAHLKAIGAWLPERKPWLDSKDSQKTFPVKASVVIPVRNRIRTIAEAVKSAVSQECGFAFNVIVVDNHSTDGTSECLQELCRQYPERLIHLIPESQGLGIGGCWNQAIQSGHCGQFAVQLDSDDLYSSNHTLQRIIDCFEQTQAAAVIGSYRLCDIHQQTLPPGLIAHQEWTDGNGHNNALRINGLGAPRAFRTSLLREILFPDTCYGEDYAVCLAVCRRWKIARIFEELYLCRRWNDNTDASLNLEKLNANNFYKDRLRSLELAARQGMNRE